jgi:hypothetical protein
VNINHSKCPKHIQQKPWRFVLHQGLLSLLTAV